MTMLSIEMWGMMAAVCCCSIGIAANISDASWGHGARIVSCFDAPTAPLARKQFIDVNPGCAPE